MENISKGIRVFMIGLFIWILYSVVSFILGILGISHEFPPILIHLPLFLIVGGPLVYIVIIPIVETLGCSVQ